MRGEIARAAWLAVFAQVRRGRDHNPGIGAEVARAQRRIGHLAHAHGQVDALFDQIDIAVVEADVDIHLLRATLAPVPKPESARP